MDDRQSLLGAEEVPLDYDPYKDPSGYGSDPQPSTTAKEGAGFDSPTTWSFLACCVFGGTLSLVVIGAIALTFQVLVDDDEVRGITGAKPIVVRGRAGWTEPSLPGIRTGRVARQVNTAPRMSVLLERVTIQPPTVTQSKPFEASTQPPPLLCSVGLTATLPLHYPPDGACDILIYTHVRVEDRKLLAVESQVSYGAFRNACKLYSESTCGLSFDVRFLHQDMLADTDTRGQLADAMRTVRINHYAIMNIYEQTDITTNFSLAAAPILREFRSLLGSDRRNHKVIIGVGFFSYNEVDSVSSLSHLAETTATSDVDIIVIITSVSMPPERFPCTTLPASALRSTNNFLLTLEKALPMAMSNFGVPSLTVAFSFQMGVLLYNMPQRRGHPIDSMYTECISMAVSNYSAACGVTPQDLHSERITIGLSSNQSSGTTGKMILQTFETLQFMIDKANAVMSTPWIRANFTWFLFNVHLTDFTRRCLPGGPFDRVKGFRDFFFWEWKRLKS